MARIVPLMLVGSFLLSLFSGCSHRKISYAAPVATDPANKAPLVVWASWVVPKGLRVQMHVNIDSKTDKSALISPADLQFFRGDTRGTLKHPFQTDALIDIRAGEHREFEVTCTVPGRLHGDFGLIVSRVYENVGNDGRTRGKVIAENIVWQGQQ